MGYAGERYPSADSAVAQYIAMENIDKAKLERALSNAVASAKMEGFSVPEAHVKMAEAIVLGTMTKEECLKHILAARA